MVYDVIIIGGGVAGLGGAVYCARFNMQTLVLAGRLGGLIQDTHIVENYPGVARWSGFEMAQAFQKHVEDYKEQVTVKEDRPLPAIHLDPDQPRTAAHLAILDHVASNVGLELNGHFLSTVRTGDGEGRVCSFVGEEE